MFLLFISRNIISNRIDILGNVTIYKEVCLSGYLFSIKHVYTDYEIDSITQCQE